MMVKPPGDNPTHLPAQQPLGRRGMHLRSHLGLALPHNTVTSSGMVKMIFWDLQERAGVCWLRLH